MSWFFWLWAGITVGATGGVLAMCLMIMARAVDVEDDLEPQVSEAQPGEQ